MEFGRFLIPFKNINIPRMSGLIFIAMNFNNKSCSVDLPAKEKMICKVCGGELYVLRG